MGSSLHELGALEAAKRISAGKITSEDLVRSCLDQIKETDPEIHAWEHLDGPTAVAQAKSCDDGPNRGLLHGVPVGVKDLIDTKDMPTRYGSSIYDGHRPLRDADCVASLREAGAVILGKTVTTEFATFTPPVTRNPHNIDRTPGGSSSGSAAAVADQMVPLALGTQTAGSIIRPAAFCGVFGFKPTFDFISIKGVKPISERLDTVGMFARNVEDIALLAGCLKYPRSTVFNLQPKLPRIGLFRGPYWDQIECSSRVAIEKAWGQLATSSSKIIGPKATVDFRQLTEAQHILMCADLAKSLRFEFDEHFSSLSIGLRQLIESGLMLDVATVRSANEYSISARVSVETLFEDCEIIVTPSALGEAPGIETTGDPLLNKAWTLLHLPCLNVPIDFGVDGLPISIKLVGRPHEDEVLINSAAAISETLSKQD